MNEARFSKQSMLKNRYSVKAKGSPNTLKKKKTEPAEDQQ